MTMIDSSATERSEPGDELVFWTRNNHLDRPVCALMESLLVDPFNEGFERGFARYDVLATGMRSKVVDGWMYVAFVPLTDPAAFGQRIGHLQGTDVLAELAANAEATLAGIPEGEARRRELGRSLDTLTGAELADRFEVIAAQVRAVVTDRFAGIPTIALAGELALAAQDAELDPESVLGALGPIAVSAATAHRLEHLAATIDRDAPALAARLRAGEPASIDDLLEVDGAAEALEADRDLLCASSLEAPTLGEQPHLVIDLLRRYLDQPAREVAATGWEIPATLQARVDDARLAQRWRDETARSMLLWLGLARRAAICAGRRLGACDCVDDAADALYLTPEEIVEALRQHHDVRPLVGGRKKASSEAGATTPPAFIGTPPTGPPPGVEELPPAMQRHMQRIQWFTSRIEAEMGPPSGDPSELCGVGASGGSVVGRARVVRGSDDFGSVEPGDVIVCTTTSPLWNAVIAVASAVVCETGGFVSHTALIARELGLPAVVGLAAATERIGDGSTVRVDGSVGRVEILP